jgi:hypothetical protein
MVNLSVAEEKVTSVEDVSGVAKEVQKELQSLYLKMRSADKAHKSASNSPQKKLMTALEDYNRKLFRLYLKGGEDKSFSHDNWKVLNASLEKVTGSTSLVAVSSDRDLLRNFRKWLRTAESLGSDSERFAVRSGSGPNSNLSQAMATNLGFVPNGNIGLVVEDYSLGLNTRQDRIALVERLTRLRAAENRVFSRGFYTTPGGYPRNYPAAYIYNNGSFGNMSTLGRRDSLTPLYNYQRQQVRKNTAPRIQIRIK